MATTTDARALQKAAANDRIAARWDSSSFFTIDLNITDGQTHRVAFYGLDWDGNNRSQRIDVTDWATNALLDSRSMSQFNGGQYLVWDIRGHVTIRVNRIGAKTAVVSGLYFGGPVSSPTPTPTPNPCSAYVTPSSLTLFSNGSGNLSVQLPGFVGIGTISSRPSAQIQVSPLSQSVSGTNFVNFTVSVRNKSGNVVVSTPCGNKTIPITVK